MSYGLEEAGKKESIVSASPMLRSLRATFVGTRARGPAVNIPGAGNHHPRKPDVKRRINTHIILRPSHTAPRAQANEVLRVLVFGNSLSELKVLHVLQRILRRPLSDAPVPVAAENFLRQEGVRRGVEHHLVVDRAHSGRCELRKQTTAGDLKMKARPRFSSRRWVICHEQERRNPYTSLLLDRR